MFDQARSLDLAQKNSELYCAPPVPSFSYAASEQRVAIEEISIDRSFASAAANNKCFFCGNARHPRAKCPARDAICNKCQKKGHFAKVCRSEPVTTVASTGMNHPTIASVTSVTGPSALSKAMCKIDLCGLEVECLIDSGSTESFIHPKLIKQKSITTYSSGKVVSMASASLSVKALGYCEVDITLKGRDYKNLRLYILPELCVDVILGLDFQQQHESVTLKYGREQPPLTLCGLTTLSVDPPELFANLTADCYPVASKSRRYSFDDRKFIEKETQRLLREGILEPSNSPWRAQIVVTKDDNHKKRLAIDYSQTINRFTLLDGYPLPCIDDTVNKIAQYRVFSTIDLRSAYHQVPIRKEDKPYTAF